jgi:Omptin family
VSTTRAALLSAGLRLALAFATSLLTAAPVLAGDWVFRPWEWPQATYTTEFGLRFWYGSSTTGKNLFDPSGTALNSRLTYSGLAIFAAEAYGRFDFDHRWFVKGYVGGGGMRQGNLKDEDFPPAIAPYSATFSIENNSSLGYASVDGGFNVLSGPDFRVGLFAGFHYLNERTTAFGCAQIAFNPFVCGPFPIPDQVKAITQDNNWYSIRLGAEAAFDFDRFRFSVDAAWLPFVWLSGSDTHWLRIGNNSPFDFTGPLPEDGRGWGYQIDAMLSYRVDEQLSVGIGGRYWSMQTHGTTHFENHFVGGGGLPAPVDWKVQNFGVFLQASLKLGPYSLIH